MAGTGTQDERRVRRRRLHEAAAALALVLGTVLPAHHATGTTRFLDGEIIISPEPMPTHSGYENSCHGYAEYRVSVTNRSRTKAHRVTLAIPADRYSQHGHNIRQITRTVVVGPSSTAIISLFQPAVPLAGSDISVRIDGRDQRYDVGCDDANHGGSQYYYGSGRTACVLTSRNVSEDFRNNAGALNINGQNVQVYRSESPVKQWSGDWLAYSRYDGLIITGLEMQQMPPRILAAITRYLECGGSLLVTESGEWKAPQEWRRDQQADMCHVGFGQCCITDQREYRPGQVVREMWERSFQPWSSIRDIEEANRLFPVIEDIEIPVRGLFILMIVFAVAIGPVNLIVLGRKRKRIWMLWTVPAVSLLTCGTVFAYATFAEGWRGHRRTETLTILDQRSHRATTIGWTAFYSPLTPGDGLRFDYETELMPQLGYHWMGMGGGSTSRTIDWTNGQHLSAGWVSARVPTHFMLRKNQTRRERIILRRSDSLVAVNGLGARISKLYLADMDGRVYIAENVQPGAEVVLTPTTQIRPVGKNDALRGVYTGNWTGIVDDFTRRPGKYLRPGTYIAALDGTPFIEGGLKNANPRRCRSVVYGIIDTDDGNTR